MAFQTLSTSEVRRIAAEIEADPRSVARELRGERVRGLVGERIRRKLAERGLPSSDGVQQQHEAA